MTTGPIARAAIIWLSVLIFFAMTGVGIGLGVKAYRWVTGDSCECTKPV